LPTTELQGQKNPRARFAPRLNELYITWLILKTSRISLIGLFIASGFVLISLFVLVTGGRFLPYNPYLINTNQILLPPSLNHIFGTDPLGRDVLSRVLAGAPTDAEVAFAVVLIAVVLGTILGSMAGYLGGVAEEIIMRVTDIFLAFPPIVLALAIAASLGPGIINSILALAPVWWPAYTRLARGEALSLKSQDFVRASRSVGQTGRYIVMHHILPNVVPVIVVYATIDFGNVIIIFSVLSYIGLGAQPPLPEWGLMSSQNELYLPSAPWAPLVPALAILIVAIGFSLLGDGLRDALDPRNRGLFS
jgi:peptide/nickel transport system permease protein